MADASNNPNGTQQAPRRDKFAALASRSVALDNSALPKPQTKSQSSEPSVSKPLAATTTAPRRDKLSALASRVALSSGSGGRGDKLAALANTNKTVATPEESSTSTRTAKQNAAQQSFHEAAATSHEPFDKSFHSSAF